MELKEGLVVKTKIDKEFENGDNLRVTIPKGTIVLIVDVPKNREWALVEVLDKKILKQTKGVFGYDKDEIELIERDSLFYEKSLSEKR